LRRIIDATAAATRLIDAGCDVVEAAAKLRADLQARIDMIKKAGAL